MSNQSQNARAQKMLLGEFHQTFVSQDSNLEHQQQGVHGPQSHSQELARYHNELHEIVAPEDQVFGVSDLKDQWGALCGTFRQNKAKMMSLAQKSGMAASDIQKVKWLCFKQLCFRESGSAKLVTASSSIQYRVASEMISIILVEATLAEDLPDIDDPVAISTSAEEDPSSNVATSIAIDLPPAMEEQDDEEDSNVGNEVQTQQSSHGYGLHKCRGRTENGTTPGGCKSSLSGHLLWNHGHVVFL